MKKLKLKKILLLFSMVLAMVGCFLVKGVSVNASDEVMSVDIAGTSNKNNIIYAEYCEELKKVVCLTSNSSICYLDYKSFNYSEEITIEEIPTNINQFKATVLGTDLLILNNSSDFSYVRILKINLLDLSYENYLTDITFDSSDVYSICKKDDIFFYVSRYQDLTMNDYVELYKFSNETMTHDPYLHSNVTFNASNILGIYNDLIFLGSGTSMIIYDLSTKKKIYDSTSPYVTKGYLLDNNNIIFVSFHRDSSNVNYYKYNTSTNSFSKMNECQNYYYTSTSISFFADNKIFTLPYKYIGYAEVLSINDFQLDGENLVFTDVNTPLSYQDILSKYTPSDKYGRSLMTSIKADSYYNSFSTPGNYDATITVSDGYCHEDFEITIVVNKGGGEEEKQENSGSSIKWDTNLMIQSFGGIAVFLVIGLLVVTVIKKILR